MFTRHVLFALLGAVLLTSTGCMIVTDEPTGTATLRWSIDQRFDARDCYFHRAANMQVSIYEAGGHYVTRTAAPCGAFSTTVRLSTGWYGASMVLVDAAGYAVSTTLDVPAFRVYRDGDMLVDTDFPSSSFY